SRSPPVAARFPRPRAAPGHQTLLRVLVRPVLTFEEAWLEAVALPRPRPWLGPPGPATGRHLAGQVIELVAEAGPYVGHTKAEGEFAWLQHEHCHLAANLQQTSIRGDQRRPGGVSERSELAVGWIGHKLELFGMRRTAEPVLRAKQARDVS